MKTLFITLLVILSALIFVGCAGKSNKEAGQYTCSMHPNVIQDHPGLCPICKMDLTKKESVSHSAMEMASATSAMPPDTPAVNAVFGNMDAEVDVHIKNVLSHYMHIKNALVNSDSAAAKNGAGMLIEAISEFDNSYFPAEQKTEYDKHRNIVKEQVQQIIVITDVEMQRGYFAMLSTHVYELAKTFDAGKKLYLNHCNMAFDENGAMWLSETSEIKNPYMGSKMMNCGSIKGMIN
jgi:hypothetical protein